MQVVTIPKTEYNRILQNQKELQSEVSALRQAVIGELGEERIRPEVLRRINRRSRAMDKGGGIRFKSAAEFKRWMQNLGNGR